jgi:hypothetical protein
VACRAVRRAIATSVVRLVIGTYWIVRTNCRALESAAKDGGESRRRSNKAAEGALCPRGRRINQDSAPVGGAAGNAGQNIDALLQRRTPIGQGQSKNKFCPRVPSNTDKKWTNESLPESTSFWQANAPLVVLPCQRIPLMW